jgi:Capsular polysaccharide synthesis protein
MTNKIPKLIWFMWLQGFDEAPMLIKKCYISWQKHNPDWKVVFLDEESVDKYVDFQQQTIKSKHISKEAYSDLVRINLLDKYGGVWVDATCFCCSPLATWLDEYTRSGFFGFYKPGRDRLISSWFLASAPNCRLTSIWRDESNKYWLDNNFTNQRNHFISDIFKKIFYWSRYATGFWFSFFARKIIKVYPYFWFHYLFGRIVQKDADCMKIWERTKKYSADIPLKLLYSGYFQPVSDEVKQFIDNKRSPLYKLTWKYDQSQYKEGCTLHYLLESDIAP